MPIQEMSFDDGIFFSQAVGYFDHVDVRRWAKTVNTYAQEHVVPIIAVIDIREVDQFCPTIVDAVTLACSQANLVSIVVVAGDSGFWE